MKLIRRCFLLAIMLFFVAALGFGGAAALRARADGFVARVGTENYATLSDALDAWVEGSTLTLLTDAESASTIEVTVNKTLDLNGHTLSVAAGAGRTLWVTGTGTLTVTDSGTGGAISGGGIRVQPGATFVLAGGSISGNVAEDGGGVYIEAGGAFQMNGGSVTGNMARGNGGGIYAAGTLILSGTATVRDNTTANGTASNVYLVRGVRMDVSDLTTGAVGVTAEGGRAEVATGNAGVQLFADDPAYTISYFEGSYAIVLSPLASIVPALTGEELVFPTTALDALRDRIQISALNENGAAYGGQLTFTLSGALSVGSSELTVAATGEGEEQASATLAVTVSVPTLESITILYEQGDAVIYYDTPLETLFEGLTVIGTYSDGLTRTILPTAEETAAQGEAYITDYYYLTGNLSVRVDDTAVITAHVMGARNFSQTFTVNVSRYILSAEAIEVQSVTVVGGEAAAALTGADFAPSLPAGVGAEVSLGDTPLSAAQLQPGVYQVTITFSVSDIQNFEAVEGERQAQLIVNAPALEGTIEGGSSYMVTAEGGVPPTWSFTVRDVTDSVGANSGLDSSLDALAAIEVSLSDDDMFVTEPDRVITFRLALSEDLREKEIRLFCVLSDGSLVEVEAQQEGEYLVFALRSAVQTRYILAADNAFGSYLIATIIFGVACLAGAGVLIWFFVKHKKMRIR